MSFLSVTTPNRFLGSPEDLFQASSTLLRLSQLSEKHPSDVTERKEMNGEILELCQRVYGLVDENFTKAKQQIEAGLDRLKLRMYEQYFSNLDIDPNRFKIGLNWMMKDAKSVAIPPIKKAHRGDRGPTFLVNYPSFDDQGNITKMKSGVIKWTNWTEILSNRIYDVVSKMLPNADFHLPKAASYDWKDRVHYSVEGKKSAIEVDLNQRLEKNFSEIKKIYCPDPDLSDREVVLYERIAGQNIFDFAHTKYQHLTTDQKQLFFKRLAMMGFTDVLLGNIDRFILADNFEGEFILNEYGEANLGNAMVEWDIGSEENPMIYAIDNGIELTQEDKEKYHLFLRKLFSDPGAIEKLTQNMIEAFKSAIIGYLDDAEGNVKIIRENLSSFNKDLASIAPEAFKEGLEQTANQMKNGLVSRLLNDETLGCVEYQKEFPDFFSTIKERLEIFTSCYQKEEVHV